MRSSLYLATRIWEIIKGEGYYERGGGGGVSVNSFDKNVSCLKIANATFLFNFILLF